MVDLQMLVEKVATSRVGRGKSEDEIEELLSRWSEHEGRIPPAEAADE
jgi:hypothetical protein